MVSILHYGSASSIALDLPDDALVVGGRAPRGEPLSDPAAAAAAALDKPLGYPPLDQAVVPGDRVALVLDDFLPEAGPIVAGAVHALVEAGIEAEDIAVVETPEGAERRAGDPRGQLAEHLAEVVCRVIHDPADERQLAYLTVRQDNEPIYLQRALCEADLVLPIGCLRLDASLDDSEVLGGLFPAFSNEQARSRCSAPVAGSRGKPRETARRKKEAEKVGWLLGVQLTLQAVPGPAGGLLHLLAGEIEAVKAKGRELCQAAWSFSIPSRAELVVASVEGGPEEQTWENIARALTSAGRIVSDEGAIALCTELATEPGEALAWLADAPDVATAMQRIREARSPDAHVAAVVAQALERGTVYLLSRLDAEMVESLGLAPVEDVREIERLVQRFGSCVLLANAQHAIATVEGEDEQL